MTIYAIYSKNESVLLAQFRNHTDASWFMQTTNEETPLELREIFVDEELDNIWQDN